MPKFSYKKALKVHVIKEIGPRPFELTLGNDSWPKQMDSGWCSPSIL